MKLLLESWKKYIIESSHNDTDNLPCQPNKRGFKQYYSIDNNNPPKLEAISKCWKDENSVVYEDNVSRETPAFYPVDEITPYREYKKGELRRDKEEFEDLKNQIQKEGIKNPITIIFGKDGKMKVGEGNHRHQIALELGMKKIPVRFDFYKEF